MHSGLFVWESYTGGLLGARLLCLLGWEWVVLRAPHHLQLLGASPAQPCSQA